MEHSDLQFDITLKVDDNMLSIFANGNYSLIKANNLFKLAIDEAVLHKKSKILIDVTKLTGTIPLPDRFHFAEFLADYRMNNALHKVNSIAVIGKEPIVHKEKFGETVAINRGTNVRVFTEPDEALVWLNSN